MASASRYRVPAHSARIALRTALLYAIVAGLWIITSDRALDAVSHHTQWDVATLQTYKGWAFVATTAVMLYLALRSQLHRLDQATARRLQDRKRLQTVQEALVDGLAVLRAVREDDRIVDFEIEYLNSAAYRLMGRTDLVGRKLLEAFPEFKDHPLFPQMIEVVETGRPLETELLFNNLDRRHFRHSCVRMGDGLVHLFQDIEPRRKAEEDLRKSERQYRELVENANSIILRLDPQGRIVFFNAFAEKFFGYSSAEVLGRDVVETLVPNVDTQGRKLAETLRDTITHPERHTVSLNENRRRNGEPVWIAWTNKAVLDEDGNLLEILCIGNDITELKHAQDEVRLLNVELERRVEERTAELKAANEELESFAGAVSHDLRGPLHAVGGFSHALAEDCGDRLGDDGRAHLKEIESATVRMGKIIEGLLELSRSTTGGLHREKVDLSELAQTILMDLHRAEPDRAVDWRVAPDMVVRGDPRMLEIVLRNLLGNAWKYCSGVAEPVIRVYAEEKNESLYFCVEDNGAGFDPTRAGKLFQPFQRLHRQNEFPGIGIGLATVRRIVHRHGGEVHATGAPGQGAKFSFSLPQPPAAPGPTNT